MAISNITDKHLQELMLATAGLELDKDKIRQGLQRNSNSYAKLQTLVRQMLFIKEEINDIIQESMINNELDKISCKFKKIPGNYYYLYQKKEGDKFFSMLEPNIWNFSDKNIFLGKYKYNYDLSLTLMQDD